MTRAERIDALAPDRSVVPPLLREMSPEMAKYEQRLSRRPESQASRLDLMRQFLVSQAREDGAGQRPVSR